MIQHIITDLCHHLEIGIDGNLDIGNKRVIVGTPTITLVDNIFTISCDTVGVNIYYTLDGSTPTANSIRYTSAVTLSNNCTIKAIAIKGNKYSAIVEETYVKPITYLTQWKIVGNSEVHDKEIWSCGEYNAVDGKYHILVQPQGGSIADIVLDEPLRMDNDFADSIEFPSSVEGKALVTRNVESKIVSAYTNKDGSQLTTTLPDNTILHIKQFVKNGDFSDGSTDWAITNSSNISCDFTQGKAIIQNKVQGYGYRYGIYQDIRSNIVIGNSYYFKYNAIPCKDIVLGVDFSNGSKTRVSCVGNTDNIVSDVVIPVSRNQFYLGFSPTTDYEIGDTTEVDNVVSFDLDVMFADCPSLKPTTASEFEALFTNLSYIDYSSGAQEVIVNDGKLYKEDVTGIEILVPLATPTTELVDAPQIQEANSYSCVISQGGKAVSWSEFLDTLNYLLTDSENNLLVDSENYQLTVQN